MTQIREALPGGANCLVANRPSAARSKTTVALVANENEKAFFYPGWDTHRLPGVELVWLPSPVVRKQAAILQDTQPEVLITSWSSPRLPDALEDHGLGGLRYVCHTHGSVRGIVPRHLLENGLIVSNWGGRVSKIVAEHALLLIMASLRQVPRWQSILEKGESWHLWSLSTRSLFGLTVGLHGFGAVGQGLAELLKPFGGKVQAYTHGLPSRFFEFHGVSECGSLEELFSTSNVVVECEALNDRTRGVVDQAMLRCLPDDAVFVNVGRSEITDEQALLAEAASGRIRVALDVFSQEPLRSDSPLLHLPDIMLSPHIAGPTADQLADCGAWAFHNIRRYLQREPLEDLVSLEIYDRST